MKTFMLVCLAINTVFLLFAITIRDGFWTGLAAVGIASAALGFAI